MGFMCWVQLLLILPILPLSDSMEVNAPWQTCEMNIRYFESESNRTEKAIVRFYDVCYVPKKLAKAVNDEDYLLLPPTRIARSRNETDAYLNLFETKTAVFTFNITTPPEAAEMLENNYKMRGLLLRTG